ncbi:MAG: MarR family transcriptional regulator [Anaerolineales bacterium]|nr:MarR family transcriptional regulator [Anaerolineales bacterium]
MERTNLGRLFFRIDHLLLSWAASHADTPFSITAFFALDHLATHGPTSMKTLAAALDITPASLTALSSKLEKAGWIERQPNPYDRRGALLVCTPAGSKKLSSDYHSMQSFFDSYLEKQEQWALSDILQVIVDHENQQKHLE